MPVVVTAAYGPSLTRSISYASPLAFVTDVQERLGLPKTGLWDDAFVRGVVAALERSTAHPAEVATLRTQLAAQTPVGVPEATAAAWAIADTRASGQDSPFAGIARDTHPAGVTVTGWTPFRFGILAVAPPDDAGLIPDGRGRDASAPPLVDRPTAKAAPLLSTTTGKMGAFAVAALAAFLWRR